MADLRLLVVADDPLARAGLAAILSDAPDFYLVGQSVAGETMGADIEAYQPDVIVWDLGWEPEGQLDLLEDLAPPDEQRGPAVIVLLPDGDLSVALWSGGIRALLRRDAPRERLIAAIWAAMRGLFVVDPSFLDRLLPLIPGDEPALSEPLTPREAEVLNLLAEGLSNRAIGQELGISEHTVKFHVNTIMGKLGVQSRTAAVVRATRLGLIFL